MKNTEDSFPPQDKSEHIEDLIQEMITPKYRKQSFQQKKRSRAHLLNYMDAIIKLYK